MEAFLEIYSGDVITSGIYNKFEGRLAPLK
jgi:hypothetical protein